MSELILSTDSSEHQAWYKIMANQFTKAGFDQTAVPFYECFVVGENARPDIPKPPMLIPVVKPSEAQLEEHGQYGRFDRRSSPEAQAAIQEHGILTLEQEEGLDPDNGVFRFEMLSFYSHMGLPEYSPIADQIKENGFQVTDRFTAAVHDQKSGLAKLTEIAKTIKNAGERTGFDVSGIDPKQWAALFREPNNMVIGTVNLPDYKFNVLAGVRNYKFPGDKIEALPLMHSIVAQKNTRPFMEDVYEEPPAVLIEAHEM